MPSLSCRLGLAALMALAASAVPSQTFYSPLYDNGVIPPTATIFRAEWMCEVPLMVSRSSPTLADVTGDGKAEVIFGTLGGQLYVLDPVTGAPLPGWPQTLTAPINTSPAVGDIDGDGQPEIVVGCGVANTGSVPAGAWSPSASGAVYGFNPDGSVVIRQSTLDWWNMATGAQVPDGCTEAVLSNPALANLDDDPALEIAYGAMDYFVYALNGAGGAFEVDAAGQNGHFALAPFPFANSIYQRDADNDGRWDEDPPGDWTAMFHPDGLPGFAGIDDDGDGLVDEGHPMDDDEDSASPLAPNADMSRVDEDGFDWPFMAQDTIWGSACLVDLNHDGQLDVVIASDFSGGGVSRGRVHALTRSGQELPGWPVDLPQLVWTPISAADVDHDGNPELFMGTNSWWHPTNSAWAGGLIFGLRADGTEIRDGDNNPSTFGVFALTEPRPPDAQNGQAPYVMGAPSIGNLDDDPDLEIVVGSYNQSTGHIWAWNPDGSLLPGFPISSNFGRGDWGPIFNSVSIADIDGDSRPEILALTGHAFFAAYHSDGSPVLGSPFWGIDFGQGPKWFGAFQTTPAVGDIDGDGRVEIVIAGRDHSILDPGHGRVFCVEAGPYNPLGMEWPMVSADARHTGVYEEKVTSSLLPGDVNEDGTVDAADLVTMRRALSGVAPLNPQSVGYRNAILDGDPPYTEEDFDILVNMILGVE
jgi:hypothetical protein